MAEWTAADIPPQEGRLAVVTGGTAGLGYETALGLARAGAAVVLAGRNREKGRAAVDRIRRALPAAQVRFEMLDLASLKSVRAFAEQMFALGRPLDLLVNNAGVMPLPTRQLTADGFEMQFGINHLGHFALTAQLLPLMGRAWSPRVVTVSSLAHRGATIDFENLQAERRYRPWDAHRQSKLANLLFAFELQRRSDAHGWGLMSNAAHPGNARTDLNGGGPGAGGLRGGLGVLSRALGHSAAHGARPTLFGATSPAAAPMGYYGPGGFYELKGPVAPARVASTARNPALARKLWKASERLTGLQWLDD